MKYFLGLDGGATKTEGVIIDEQEKLVAHIIGGPVNYHQGGEEETKHNLEKVIEESLVQANLKIEEISFAVLGLAGRDTKKDEKILDEIARHLFNGSFREKIEVVSDVEIAYKATITRDYGIVLISGTGANCFAKGKNGQVAWAGDWGWLLGDQGSGFALGLGALKRVMREFDGRGPATSLTRLILAKLGLGQASDLSHWVYQKEIPIKDIAGLAPLVFEAYKRGDKVAQNLVNKLVVEMVISLEVVAKKTNLLREKFEIGLVGGVFKEKLVVELFKERIKQTLPKAKLVLSGMEPALVAAIMAKNFKHV